MLSRRNPTKQNKLHQVKEIATWDELETKEITYLWTSNWTSWGKLGQDGASWGELGQVGNQRNYRILTLKKTSRERIKKEEEYRI